jgi:hypothetical protein
VNSDNPKRWSVEKNLSSRKELIERLRCAGFKNIKSRYYGWFPNRLRLRWVNEILIRMPIIREASLYIWIRAEK